MITLTNLMNAEAFTEEYDIMQDFLREDYLVVAVEGPHLYQQTEPTSWGQAIEQLEELEAQDETRAFLLVTVSEYETNRKLGL